MKNTSLFPLAILSLLAPCALLADNPDWTQYAHSFRVRFPGFASPTTLTDFPVLVRLPASFDYDGCAADGADLRFEWTDGSLLASEIDTWNPDGESLVWVKIPTLASGTEIIAHYGNASPDSVTPGNVWDANYVSVYHLGGSGLPLAESTGHGQPFSFATGAPGYAAPGIVGGAVDLTQSGAFCNLVCDDDDNLDGLEDLTIEVWTKQSFRDDAHNRFLLTKRTTYNSDYSFALFQQYNTTPNSPFVFCYTLDGTTTRWANANRTVAEPGAWTHTVYTRVSAQSTLTAWHDAAVAWTGTHANNYPAGALWNSSTGLRLGGDTANFNQMFPGLVDEIRISKIVRSDLWIKTSYDTAANPHFAECDFGNDWTAYAHRIDIRFSGYAGSTTLTDFPVLVRLSGANGFDYAECRIPDGGDLRFADANGNLLASEIDTWNTNGTSLVWVKVPLLNSGSAIAAYYGCATPGPANRRDVWSNGYEGVWHLGDAGLIQRDSTTNGLDFTTTYTYAPKMTFGVEDGIVGKTVKFFAAEDVNDKKGGIVASDPDGRLVGPPAKTFEFWTRQNHHEPAGTAWNGYYMNYVNTSSSTMYSIYEVAGKGKNGAWAYRLTNGTDRAQQWFSVNDQYYPARNEWTHHAYRYDTVGGKLPWAVFLRGGRIALQNGPAEEDGWMAATGSLILGNNTQGSSNVFPGNIDEVRISSVARSDDWIIASYDTIVNESFAEYEPAGDETEVWKPYAHKFSVTFPGYAGSAALADFPVLVKISTNGIAGFRYADCALPDGGDLRFADETGNLLASEIDTWDTNGTSLVWVKVPSLTAATKIKGYYGNAAAATVAGKDVWSNGFIGVWHLGETGLVMKDSSWKSAAFKCAADSTTNKVGRGVPGLVGGSTQFNKAGDKKGSLTAASTKAYDSLPAITVELWLNFDEHRTDNNTFILCKWENWNSDGAFSLYDNYSSNPNNKSVFAIYREGQPGMNSDARNYASLTACDTGVWCHQAFTYDSATKAWASYKDKERTYGTTPYNDHVRTSAGPLFLGNGSISAAQCFLGKIDEVRISNVARSQDWVNATYDTIMDNANFSRYSAALSNVDATIFILR